MHLSKPSVYINTGKGGVGKSTVCVATALYNALENKQPTLIIDADGGVAGARTLQHEIQHPNVIEPTRFSDLAFASIQFDDTLQSLELFKERNEEFKEYMKQFPADYGLVVFNDMLHEFFGAMTDVEGVHKFVSLVNIIQQAKLDGYQNIHIDVEPTSGFKRLINGAERAAHSMKNLSETGRIKLALMGATGRKDIKSYLEDAYFKSINLYKKRILDTQRTMVDGSFNMVSTAEPDPMRQATGEVFKTLRDINADINSLVVNCFGRGDAAMEEEVVRLAQEALSGTSISLKKVKHNPQMFQTASKQSALLHVAEQILSQQ